MPYTHGVGDYYTGDNYAAGGLGSFLGGLVKKAGKLALGAAKLTPIGRAVSTAVDVVQAVRRPRPSAPALVPVIDYSGGGMDVDVPRSSGVAGAGTAGVNPYMYDERGRRPGDTGRKGHFKKDGTWTNRARPRMNPTNFKALRRAARRAHSFLRIARSAVRYYTPKAPKGKAYVAFRKKSK